VTALLFSGFLGAVKAQVVTGEAFAAVDRRQRVAKKTRKY
jgi:hypothetical protein